LPRVKERKAKVAAYLSLKTDRRLRRLRADRRVSVSAIIQEAVNRYFADLDQQEHEEAEVVPFSSV
jgi:hypothetical protein